MIFPNTDAFGQAMFEEALRHLQDAYVLHQASRWPGAITSSMKAAELGFKSILILEETFGWWEKVTTSHSPMGDASAHAVLSQIVTRFSPRLVSTIKEMERLSPSQLGRKAFSGQNQDERNPEYPFVLVDETGVSLGKPSSSFVDFQISENYYEAARELLITAAGQYAVIGGWGLIIPDPLQ